MVISTGQIFAEDMTKWRALRSEKWAFNFVIIGREIIAQLIDCRIVKMALLSRLHEIHVPYESFQKFGICVQN
jgi:hypothetical protein